MKQSRKSLINLKKILPVLMRGRGKLRRFIPMMAIAGLAMTPMSCTPDSNTIDGDDDNPTETPITPDDPETPDNPEDNPENNPENNPEDDANIEKHDTYYEWKPHSAPYDRDVYASADSAEVANVYIWIDSLECWGYAHVSGKKISIQDRYNRLLDRGLSQEKADKVKYIGTLNYIYIDVIDDSIWVSQNTQLKFKNTIRDQFTH